MSKMTFIGELLAVLIVLILMFSLYTLYTSFPRKTDLKHNQDLIQEEHLQDIKQWNIDQWTIESQQLLESNGDDAVVLNNRHYEFQAGINLLVYGHPDISDAKRLFKRLRHLGVNSIAIVFPFFQADWQADVVEISPDSTPTESEIEELIKAAHAEDFHVMLRPILDEQSILSSEHWRGMIQPKNPESWFESYYQLLLKYAKLAQATGVEVFNIGTEFNSLESPYQDTWLKIIEDLSKVYEGKFTYSFNWDRVQEIPNIEFVSKLDYVGIDAYFPLDAPDGADINMLEKAWAEWTNELEKQLSPFPIVITEAGMIPVSGAYRMPYAWSLSGKLDYQAQAQYYEATYKVWRPMVEGIYWWCVTLDDPNPNLIDYSPLNSTTESMIQQIYLNHANSG